MSQTIEQILPSLIALPPADRAFIADQLLASLPEDTDPDALHQELDRRYGKHLSGESPGVPAEEAFRRLREKYP